MVNERQAEIETLLQVIPAKQRQLYTKEQAKLAALATLGGIKSRYDLNGEPLHILLQTVQELVMQNESLDLRAVSTLLDREVAIAKNNERNIYYQWATADWATIVKRWEDSDKDPLRRVIEIPLYDPDNGELLCKLQPLALETDNAAVHRELNMHFPDESGDVGKVFSTSKEDYLEVLAWRKQLDKDANKYTRVELAHGFGAPWQLPLYERVGEKNRESLVRWLKLVLEQKAKREIELSRVTVTPAPNIVILKGINGRSFMPGFRLELSDYARQTFKGCG